MMYRAANRRPGDLHESSLVPSRWRRSEEMPALAAVRPARPPAAIKAAFSVLPEPTSGSFDLIPLGKSSESSTVSSSPCSLVFLLKGRMLGRLRSPRATRRLRDRVDELPLAHRCPSLDTDASRELEQLRLVVRLQTAVCGLPLELARGVLCGRL